MKPVLAWDADAGAGGGARGAGAPGRVRVGSASTGVGEEADDRGEGRFFSKAARRILCSGGGSPRQQGAEGAES